MKIVMFDLGRTLEVNDVLLPGAKETLEAIQQLKDATGRPPTLALLSDYFPGPRDLGEWRDQYIDLLDRLGLRSFFEPVDRQVTISTDLVELVFKPDERLFRAAIDKIDPQANFPDVIFITERLEHVNASRDMGMRAVHFQGPGETNGDVQHLIDLVPIVRAFVELT